MAASSQGFTLGLVPSALQAEAFSYGRAIPRVSPRAWFRRPFRPRGSDVRPEGPEESSPGFHPISVNLTIAFAASEAARRALR